MVERVPTNQGTTQKQKCQDIRSGVLVLKYSHFAHIVPTRYFADFTSRQKAISQVEMTSLLQSTFQRFYR